MQAFAQWAVESETLHQTYVLTLMAVMFLPMLGLALWYHSNINKTEGGKALMEAQNSPRHRPNLAKRFFDLMAQRTAHHQVQSARQLHGEIMSGKYGDTAKSMQKTVYKVCAWWLTAVALLGAIPIVLTWLAAT